MAVLNSIPGWFVNARPFKILAKAIYSLTKAPKLEQEAIKLDLEALELKHEALKTDLEAFSEENQTLLA